jgi:hypothetical protein
MRLPMPLGVRVRALPFTHDNIVAAIDAQT